LELPHLTLVLMKDSINLLRWNPDSTALPFDWFGSNSRILFGFILIFTFKIFRIPKFFGLLITEEILVIKMGIWCIRIGIVWTLYSKMRWTVKQQIAFKLTLNYRADYQQIWSPMIHLRVVFSFILDSKGKLRSGYFIHNMNSNGRLTTTCMSYDVCKHTNETNFAESHHCTFYCRYNYRVSVLRNFVGPWDPTPDLVYVHVFLCIMRIFFYCINFINSFWWFIPYMEASLRSARSSLFKSWFFTVRSFHSLENHFTCVLGGNAILSRIRLETNHIWKKKLSK
jgi:hypothetical protein